MEVEWRSFYAAHSLEAARSSAEGVQGGLKGEQDGGVILIKGGFERGGSWSVVSFF